MSFGDISKTTKLAYQANVTLAVQQMKAKFERGFTFHAGLKGRSVAMLDLVGATTAIIDGARGGDTPNIEGSHDSVWVKPRQVEWGKIIEKEDAIKSLEDYQSAYVQAGAKAVMRGKESILAGAIYGSKYVGLDGSETEAYSSTGRLVAETVGSVDGATAVGMNVQKILRAFKLLEDAEIDVEDEAIFLALNSTEIEQLYNDLTYVNKDYRSKAVLEEKRVLSILGVDIISTQRLPNADSDTHRAFLWLKSGMHWGEFSPVETTVDRNPAKKFRPHAYIETWIGATRGENEKVIEIQNAF